MGDGEYVITMATLSLKDGHSGKFGHLSCFNANKVMKPDGSGRRAQTNQTLPGHGATGSGTGSLTSSVIGSGTGSVTGFVTGSGTGFVTGSVTLSYRPDFYVFY